MYEYGKHLKEPQLKCCSYGMCQNKERYFDFGNKKKKGFVLFTVDVTNCTAQTDMRTEKSRSLIIPNSTIYPCITKPHSLTMFPGYMSHVVFFVD